MYFQWLSQTTYMSNFIADRVNPDWAYYDVATVILVNSVKLMLTMNSDIPELVGKTTLNWTGIGMAYWRFAISVDDIPAENNWLRLYAFALTS